MSRAAPTTESCSTAVTLRYEFQVRVQNPAGRSLEVATDFLLLTTERKVNDYGLMQARFASDHQIVAHLQPGNLLSMWWRAPEYGIGWRQEWLGIVYDLEIATDDQGITTATVTAASPLVLLAEVKIARYAGVTGQTVFLNTAAETIMHTLVRQNRGGLAKVVNARLLDGPLPIVAAEVDQGRGTVVKRWSCAHKTLLENLQALAPIAAADFDVIRSGGGWFFRFYPGQRGQDRTSGRGRVQFGVSDGTMQRPSFRQRNLGVATVAVVLGEGQGVARSVAIAYHPTLYSATEHREMIVDARNETGATADELADLGLARLLEQTAEPALAYRVVQLPDVHYGLAYEVGDLITARYMDTVYQQQVTSAAISVRGNGPPAFDISVGGYLTNEEQRLARINALQTRLESLETQE